MGFPDMSVASCGKVLCEWRRLLYSRGAELRRWLSSREGGTNGAHAIRDARKDNTKSRLRADDWPRSLPGGGDNQSHADELAWTGLLRQFYAILASGQALRDPWLLLVWRRGE
jgi:hypothetical protein